MSCCVALLGHELLPIPYWTEQCHGLYACHLCGNIPIGYTRHVTWLAPSIVVLRIPWEQEYKDLSGSSCINSYTSKYALICAAVSGLNCSEYICFRLSVCLFLILVVSLQLESNHSTNRWFEMGNLQLLIYQKPIFPRPITRISIDTWTPILIFIERGDDDESIAAVKTEPIYSQATDRGRDGKKESQRRRGKAGNARNSRKNIHRLLSEKEEWKLVGGICVIVELLEFVCISILWDHWYNFRPSRCLEFLRKEYYQGVQDMGKHRKFKWKCFESVSDQEVIP